MERWETTSMDRGTCPGCGGEYQLTKRGRLRAHVHRVSREDCPGSGQWPRRGEG